MAVSIVSSPFDPLQALSTYQNDSGFKGQLGATNLFIGTMRGSSGGKAVEAMTLEHYPGMTESELAKITQEAAEKWHILDSLVIHRVGDILPGETIVLTAVWASHRGDAFDANRYIMEALKSRAPFWKKERLTAGDTAWVAANTNGYGV